MLRSMVPALALSAMIAPAAFAEPAPPEVPAKPVPGLIASVPPPPVQVNLGLLAMPFPRPNFGLEGEVSLGGFALGGLAWPGMFSGGAWSQSAWAGYGIAPRPGDRLMLLAGRTHYIQSGVGCAGIGGCTQPAQGGTFVALSYLIREERLWMKLTPQFYMPDTGGSAYPPWALSGLPWVEIGVPITPWCDISFRLGETLFKVAIHQ